MKLESGQTIARYRLVEPIGEGGMGVVWRADDLELGRPVALKFLTAEALASEDRRARFLREARTAASLNHPGICTIYEVGEHDRVPFIAMELIEGTTLDDLVRKGDRLPLSQILKTATQIGEGLAAAHARGIVHRDLKPANVILTEDGRAKILDFGLAKPHSPVVAGDAETAIDTISADMTREGRILGTVAYMSPEQAQGKPVDSRSDVFSFGILLYQLASGKLPFRGETTASTLAKILESEPEPLSVMRAGVPAELERIVRRCLHKRAADRYNDTRDLVAALRDLHASGDQKSVPPPRRKWTNVVWPWIGLALVALVLVFVVKPLLERNEKSASVAAVAERPSVAVLPFQSLGTDQASEYFSAGMTEELISKLSRIEGLEVASRSSVARYKDADRDARTTSEELGVRYLLDGSVRRVEDRVRITAQLVDGSTGRILWSEDFDGSLDDIFAMQERTALEIAEQLDLQLSPQEEQDLQRRSTDNVLAYDAYLQAHAALRSWDDRDKLDEARARFEQALEYDADYALALAGLASVEAQIYRNFDSSEARIQRAERLAQRAMELDLESARAHMALGEIAAMRYDYERAVRLFREATHLEPADPIHWDFLSWALAYQTPPDSAGAVSAARKAIELQPDFSGAFYHLGRALLQMGEHEEARAAFERCIELNPKSNTGFLGMAQYHLALGDYDSAMAAANEVWKGAVIEVFYVSLIHAAAGEADQALQRLDEAFAMGFRDFVSLDSSPYLSELRNDPRYHELVRRYRDR